MNVRIFAFEQCAVEENGEPFGRASITLLKGFTS